MLYRVINRAGWPNLIFGDPGAVSRGERQIKRTKSGAHYPERAGERTTAINSCNGVFTSRFIFREAFPARITGSLFYRSSSELLLSV